MGKQTFNIHDGTGAVLASVIFYNYGVNFARNEAVKVAELLAEDGWSISEGQLTRLQNQEETQSA